MIDRYGSAYCLVDQNLCLVDTICYRNHDHRLSVKTGHFHVLIRCYDDRLCCRNLLFCQHILGTAGAICLSLQGNPQLLSCIFQIFRCHVRMGNTCRAGSYS